ncbi:MAG TPA: S41 family peptidase [Verrucomicrobiae bacterium]|jgi:hypothetical protein
MKNAFLVVFAAFLSCAPVFAREAADFKEVYDLLRANLAGVDEAELNKAAVAGLISQLSPRVSLVTEAKGSNAASVVEGVLKTAIYDQSYAYIRLGKFGKGIEKETQEAFDKLAASNRVRGLVLDLRYSSGDNYAAAAALADWFFTSEQPLLDYGDGLKKSAAKAKAFSLPLTVLVNKKTSGAAEAFTGVLKQAGVGLVLGSTTAGQASIAREFTLKNGQHIRIATTPVKYGDGKPFPLAGIAPDITVEVAADEEKGYFDDAFKLFAKAPAPVDPHLTTGGKDPVTGTNRPPRRRMNEAELVRMTREGQSPETDTVGREPDVLKPMIHDPVLARAIDLLKGLAVVRQARNS